MREATKVHQWKNTTAVIEWFKNTPTRPNSTFLSFDVVNFYPSINQKLLTKAIQYAKTFIAVTPAEEEIIFHAKNTLLFHNNETWQKANAEGLYDVTMGSYDGAETCELVGTYILAKVSSTIPKTNIGLYRDDGLAVVHSPPRAAENIKKKLCKKFREFGLQKANANTIVVNILDVTFNLTKKEYRPYSKQGDCHLYVHAESNHPKLSQRGYHSPSNPACPTFPAVKTSSTTQICTTRKRSPMADTNPS